MIPILFEWFWRLPAVAVCSTKQCFTGSSQEPCNTKEWCKAGIALARCCLYPFTRTYIYRYGQRLTNVHDVHGPVST